LSAKLDRLAVGSILKQVNEVFLLSVLLMRTLSSYQPSTVTYLVAGSSAESSRNERMMDGH
jgi:hypothetical protein